MKTVFKPPIIFLAMALFLAQSGKVWASPLTFCPASTASPASLSCRVQVDRIGDIDLKNGSASIAGNTITISAQPDEYSETRVVLSGIIIKLECDWSHPEVTGLAYFQAGELWNKLNDPQTSDIIFRTEGGLSGKISGLRNHSLQVIGKDGAPLSLDISSVKFVRSPRSFLFRIPLAVNHPLTPGSPFKAESDLSFFTATASRRSLPLSSILPNPPRKGEDALGLDGQPVKYGDVTLDDDSDEEPPLFKWQPGGMHLFP